LHLGLNGRSRGFVFRDGGQRRIPPAFGSVQRRLQSSEGGLNHGLRLPGALMLGALRIQLADHGCGVLLVNRRQGLRGPPFASAGLQRDNQGEDARQSG